MSDVETQLAEAAERESDAAAAEADLIERLQQRNMADVWQRVRDRLHCERFMESRTGKRVYERLVRDIVDAQTEWLLAADPTKPEVVEAHRRAQASHTAIFTIDAILADGGEAEKELDQIARELGE